MPGGRPPKFKRPHELTRKINEYFADNKNQPFTIGGLCIYLNTCYDTLLEYESKPQFSETIKKAKSKIEDHIHKLGLTNVYNPTITIFTLKNNFGWKDKQDIESVNKNDSTHKLDLSTLTDEQLTKLLGSL